MFVHYRSRYRDIHWGEGVFSYHYYENLAIANIKAEFNIDM